MPKLKRNSTIETLKINNIKNVKRELEISYKAKSGNGVVLKELFVQGQNHA